MYPALYGEHALTLREFVSQPGTQAVAQCMCDCLDYYERACTPVPHQPTTLSLNAEPFVPVPTPPNVGPDYDSDSDSATPLL